MTLLSKIQTKRGGGGEGGGGGGVLKSSEGNWLKGFARSPSHTTSVMAEIWDLKDRLLSALQIGASNILVELDAKIIIKINF